MTDAFIIQGLMTNNPVVWRYIYRNLKSPFISALKKHPSSATLSAEDWDDIYQEACVKLMENVKQGKFEERPGSGLFSYFVEIGKRTMMNIIRKSATRRPKHRKDDGTPHLFPAWSKATPQSQDDEDGVLEVSEEEKQNAQNEFIDRVFDSVPGECQRIFKMFYWDHKPMDEIASVFGLRNANSAKTKKTRCMTMFKNVKDMLINSGEFDEELVRAAAERAALRDLLQEEKEYEKKAALTIAALKIETDDDKPRDTEE